MSVAIWAQAFKSNEEASLCAHRTSPCFPLAMDDGGSSVISKALSSHSMPQPEQQSLWQVLSIHGMPPPRLVMPQVDASSPSTFVPQFQSVYHEYKHIW